MNRRKRSTKIARPERRRSWRPTDEAQSLERRDRERTRIARELHDELGPTLSLARLNVEALQNATGAGAAKRIAEAIELLDQAIERVRTLSFELGPALLDELGLGAAAARYVRRVAATAGLRVDEAIEPLDAAIPNDIAESAFRVLQEAVTNVVRHARAGRLAVRLGIRDGELDLSVRDDGIGFDVRALEASPSSEGRLGLVGMRERVAALGGGGAFTLDSTAGVGTVVTARFPLHRASLARVREADPHSPRR